MELKTPAELIECFELARDEARNGNYDAIEVLRKLQDQVQDVLGLDASGERIEVIMRTIAQHYGIEYREPTE